MATRAPVFANPDEERSYLIDVKAELDAAQTKDDIVQIWKKHYLKIGHRKLGRLLLGRSIDEIVRST
jgi:hypothetical protein